MSLRTQAGLKSRTSVDCGLHDSVHGDRQTGFVPELPKVLWLHAAKVDSIADSHYSRSASASTDPMEPTKAAGIQVVT